MEHVHDLRRAKGLLMLKLPSWFDYLSDSADRKQLQEMREDFAKKMLDPRFAFASEALAVAKTLRGKASSWTVENEAIRIGIADDLNAEEKQKLKTVLDAFRPWKKGPYTIFGEAIDAEWRSDIKWNRVKPALRSIEGEVIADIGCHNGYFMYRMVAEGARHVIGFEPVPVNAYNHLVMQEFAPVPEISFELFGVEHIDLFPETFDTIFCMGILYHHTDPIGLLRKMKKALKPKGRLVIDCQGIAGSESISLTPSGRYAGASGVWYLPTMTALQNWVKRAGFSQQNAFYSEALSSEEQRATDWADVKSLQDFLDPNDPTKTVEGYPAPYRHYLIAKA